MAKYKTKKPSNQKAFTLVELLVVIAIIGALAVIVLVSINISKVKARNSKRESDVETILNSVYRYSIDNQEDVDSIIDSTPRMLGTDIAGCDISCAFSSTGSGSFTDDEQSEFDAGTYADTQWDGGNSWVELNAAGQANRTGTYTSNIFDAGSSTTWDTLSWIPNRPYYKELPDNAQSESGYPNGNANMNGNVLLMHLNESSGTINDTSGQGNNGTAIGGVTYSAGGKLNTALSFDGNNDVVSIPDDNSLDITGNIAIEFWIYPHNYSNYPDIITKGSYTQAYSVWVNASGRIIFELNSNSMVSTQGIPTNNWSHVVVLRSGITRRIYINGQLSGSSIYFSAIGTTNNALTLSTSSYPFSGRLDEVAVYNRGLSPTEIQDHYLRGANRLKTQVRSCDDAACSGESFVGPDGTAGTQYSELNNSATNPPSFNVTNLSDNQYFQYQTTFETDNSSYSPELVSNTVNYSGGGTMTTDSACLDLTSRLVPDFVGRIPTDPVDGSEGKTYYAIRRTASTGGAEVVACRAENGETIRKAY